jgi:hypothetical protein
MDLLIMTKTIISEAVTSAMTWTAEITNKWNDRLTGSDDCKACSQYLQSYFSEFCDQVNIQHFTTRPLSFLGFIKIGIVLFGIAIALLLSTYYLLAFLISISICLLTIFQFFLYKELIDIFYPKRESTNVFGSIEPTGKVEQQIIISAHHDSAHVFNLLEKNPSNYVAKVNFGFGTIIALLPLSLLLVLFEHFGMLPYWLPWVIIAILVICASFSLPALWFFFDAKKGTPGAGDNMICVAIAAEVGKYFSKKKKAGEGLKNTRLIIASWDAEECGLRGARHYVNTHHNQLKKVATYNFNLECMYDYKKLHLMDSDLNGFVRLSEKMNTKITSVAASLGYDIPIQSFPLLAGGTDAAEFAKKDIHAITLAAMDWTKKDEKTAYHTTRDTIDAVDAEAVKRSIEIACAYIRTMDNL